MSQERSRAPRVVRPSLRVTLIGSDYDRIGDLVSINASSSGLLVASATSSPIPVTVGQPLEGVIWDTDSAGNVPFRARVARVEPAEGPVERLGLQLTWIDPSSYMAFQQLVYGQPG